MIPEYKWEAKPLATVLLVVFILTFERSGEYTLSIDTVLLANEVLLETRVVFFFAADSFADDIFRDCR